MSAIRTGIATLAALQLMVPTASKADVTAVANSPQIIQEIDLSEVLGDYAWDWNGTNGYTQGGFGREEINARYTEGSLQGNFAGSTSVSSDGGGLVTADAAIQTPVEGDIFSDLSWKMLINVPNYTGYVPLNIVGRAQFSANSDFLSLGNVGRFQLWAGPGYSGLVVVNGYPSEGLLEYLTPLQNSYIWSRPNISDVPFSVSAMFPANQVIDVDMFVSLSFGGPAPLYQNPVTGEQDIVSDDYCFYDGDGNQLCETEYTVVPGGSQYFGATGIAHISLDPMFSVDPSFTRPYTIDSGVPSSIAAPASMVPEPASWALMIAGFGLLGAAARRRAIVENH